METVVARGESNGHAWHGWLQESTWLMREHVRNYWSIILDVCVRYFQELIEPECHKWRRYVLSYSSHSQPYFLMSSLGGFYLNWIYLEIDSCIYRNLIYNTQYAHDCPVGVIAKMVLGMPIYHLEKNRMASRLSTASTKVDSRLTGSLVSKFVLTETNSWPVI